MPSQITEPDHADTLKCKADHICSLIVGSECRENEIDREIRNLRSWCADYLPDRVELFDLIYLSRFQRLREQFRSS